MHSFLDFAEPHAQAMLWVQVYGMPVAFLIRSVILTVRLGRESVENRGKNALRAVANLLFAISCLVFSFSAPAAAISFSVGVGLSIKAFIIARAQAIEIGEQVKLARGLTAKQRSIPVSIRNSRLGKPRNQAR